MQLWNSQISILPAGLKTHSMDQHSALRPVIRLLASFSSVPPSSSSAFTGPWPQAIAASYFEYSSLSNIAWRMLLTTKKHCPRIWVAFCKWNSSMKKSYVNMWNKADICTVLLSNETSTAPFPRCLQNVADISRTNVHRFVQEETLEWTEFQRK